jgi:hypothetical protein
MTRVFTGVPTEFARRLVRDAVETTLLITEMMSKVHVQQKIRRGRTSRTDVVATTVKFCRYYPLLRKELGPWGTVASSCTVCFCNGTVRFSETMAIRQAGKRLANEECFVASTRRRLDAENVDARRLAGRT